MLKNLDNLSSSQLAKIASNLNEEIERRNAIEAAEKEINKILKTRSLTLNDLNIMKSLQSRKASQKKTAKAKKSGRSVVAPKYFDPDSGASWSGRGRAPLWVTNLCEKKGITLKEFKAMKVAPKSDQKA